MVSSKRSCSRSRSRSTSRSASRSRGRGSKAAKKSNKKLFKSSVNGVPADRRKGRCAKCKEIQAFVGKNTKIYVSTRSRGNGKMYMMYGPCTKCGTYMSSIIPESLAKDCE
jgi:hypothetical protein